MQAGGINRALGVPTAADVLHRTGCRTADSILGPDDEPAECWEWHVSDSEDGVRWPWEEEPQVVGPSPCGRGVVYELHLLPGGDPQFAEVPEVVQAYAATVGKHVRLEFVTGCKCVQGPINCGCDGVAPKHQLLDCYGNGRDTYRYRAAWFVGRWGCDEVDGNVVLRKVVDYTHDYCN